VWEFSGCPDQLHHQPVAVGSDLVAGSSACRSVDAATAMSSTPRFQKSATAVPRLLSNRSVFVARPISLNVPSGYCANTGCAPSRANNVYQKIARIKEIACVIEPLVTHHLVQKIQLDFGVFVVVYPAVGGVQILPAVVIEIGQVRAPEPPWRIGVGLQVTSSNVPSPFVPQQGVPRSHIFEHLHELELRLLEDLKNIGIAVHHPLPPGIDQVPKHRWPLGKPRLL
jgi:hypothetical protein